MVVVVLCSGIASQASAQQYFTWQGDDGNNNWKNSKNWGQNPGSGAVPDADNHFVGFNDNGNRRNIDVNGNIRDVGGFSILVNNVDYTFNNGTIRNFGNLAAETNGRSAVFSSDIEYQQVATGNWTGSGNGATFDSGLAGTGTINVLSGRFTFNAAGSYAGTMRIDRALTAPTQITLNNGNALQNAVVILQRDNLLNTSGLNTRLAALGGEGDLAVSGNLTLGTSAGRGNVTYSGSLTCGGFGKTLAFIGDKNQRFTGNVSSFAAINSIGGAGELLFDGATVSTPILTVDGSAVTLINGADATLGLSGPSNGSVLTVRNGGTFEISNSTVTAASLAGNGNIVLDDPTSAVALTVGQVGSHTPDSTFSGNISGIGSLRKVGGGTLTLNGSNSWSGDTLIDAGTLTIAGNHALSDSDVVVAAGASLVQSGSRLRINSLTGAGDVALNGANNGIDIGGGETTTFSGSINGGASTRFDVSGGTLTLTGQSSFGWLVTAGSGKVILDGATVELTGTNSIGGRDVSIVGGTSVNVNDGLVSVDGAVLVSGAGTSVVGTGSTRGFGAFTVQQGANYETGTLAPQGEFSVLSGASLTADTVQLLPGSMFVNSQLRVAGANSTLTTGAMDLGISASLVVEDGGSLFVSGDTNNDSDFSLGGTGTAITVNGGTLITGTLNRTNTTMPTLAISDPVDGVALTVGTNDGDSVWDGVITDAAGGAGTVRKVGTGALTLSAANTYSGGVVLEAGRLRLANSQAAGTGSITALGGTLDYANFVSVGNTIDLQGDLTMQVSGNGATHTGDIGETGSSYTLRKTGSGTLRLTGSNSSTGGFELLGGTLSALNPAALGSGDIVAGGAEKLLLEESGTYANDIVLQDSLLLETGSVNLLLTGTISETGGSFGLQTRVLNTLTLAGASTFTGGVRHGSGELRLDHNQALGTGDLSIIGFAQLALAGATSVANNVDFDADAVIIVPQGVRELSGTLSEIGGPRRITTRGTGTLVLSGNSTIAGTLSVGGAGLTLVTDDAAGTAAIDLAPSATLSYADGVRIANPLTLNGQVDLNVDIGSAVQSGTIAEAGANKGIVKTGAGTLTLLASSSYTGDTSIESGTLSLAEAYLADTADVFLAGAATLQLTHTETDVINKFILGGFSRGIGTHGAIGSGADFEWPEITGTGLLEVTSFTGLAGDYNADGTVNLADYTVWRDHLGSPAGTLLNDPNAEVIGPAQYTTWKTNFGNTLPPVSSLAQTTVPEPSTGFLLTLLALMGTYHCRLAKH